MKGIVFNEFFSLVDDAFGAEVTEKIIVDAELANDGAYTGVGNYDAAEMVRLVKCLHAESNVPVADLLQTFGKHLLGIFRAGHTAYFESCKSLFEFVRSVEDQIHVDVLKLYPDAELPHLTATQVSNVELRLVYRSSRRMADLAEGLLWGAIDHYGEAIDLTRTELPDVNGDQCAQFTLVRR